MNRSVFHKLFTFGTMVAIWAASFLTTVPAQAQVLGERLGKLGQRLRQPQASEEPIAVAGTPFGVGRLSVPLPPGSMASPLDARTLVLTEKNGRALYCTTVNRPVRSALQGILN